MKKCKWSMIQIAFVFMAMLSTQFVFGQSYVASDQAVDILIQEAESTLVDRTAATEGSDQYAMLTLEKDLYKYTAHYIGKEGMAVSQAIDRSEDWLEDNAGSYYNAITEGQRKTLHLDLKDLLDN